MSLNQMTTRDRAQQWVKPVMLSLLLLLLVFLASHAYASDGTEFQAATDKFKQWVQGNLGKLAALISLAVGAVVAAVRKDWSWFFGAMVLSIGMGVMLSVVDASFTATL